MNKHPIGDCIITAAEHIKKGGEIHQKFECEKCGEYNWIEEKNTFYESGQCEKCKHVTDLTKTGCNYTLVMRNPTIQDIENLTKQS